MLKKKKDVDLDKCCRYCHYYDGISQKCTNPSNTSSLDYGVSMKITNFYESGELYESIIENLLPTITTICANKFSDLALGVVGYNTKKKMVEVLKKSFEEEKHELTEEIDLFISEKLNSIDLTDCGYPISDPETHTCKEWR